MEKFVEHPNLPESNVSIAVLSSNNNTICNGLSQFGMKIIPTEELKNLHEFEKFHADLQLLHFGDSLFITFTDVKNYDFLIPHRTYFSPVGKYPNNILLNALIIGQYIFCHKKYINKTVIEIAEQKNMEVVHVNQGYTKCSAAVVSENALITADDSIFLAASKKGLDVLKIRPGFIELPGVNYGFIGGTCGKIDKNTLAFAGKVESHPDYELMKSFAQNYHVDLYSLTNEPLYDIGGIIPIKEKFDD
ncbi:MAG: hypothetical protein Q8876_03885 [Bacillota bacterium]|nr:hypothetical protein [Bacillota bacterium]